MNLFNQNPEHIFLDKSPRLFSYQQLFNYAQAIIDGIENGDQNLFILIKADDPFTTMAKLLACLKAERKCLIINPNIDRATYEYINQFYPYEDHEISLPLELDHCDRWDINPDLSLIHLLTSGSTGTPKLIGHGFEALYVSALGTNEYFEFDEKGTWALALPFHHMGGLMILIRALVAKATVIDVDLALNRIQKLTKRDMISLVPTQLQRLLNENDAGLDVRVLLGGGAPSQALLDKIADTEISVFQGYGMTETCSHITVGPIKNNSCGNLLLHRNLEIINDDIYVGGKVLCQNIYQDGKRIGPQLENDLMKTSDMGMIKDGELVLLGRRDQVFNSGGELVNPFEVKTILLSHPVIMDALIISVEDDEYGHVGHAYLVFKDESSLNKNDLSDFMKSHLAGYKVPKKYFHVPNKETMKLTMDIINNGEANELL